jgi:hypothetical protein
MSAVKIPSFSKPNIFLMFASPWQPAYSFIYKSVGSLAGKLRNKIQTINFFELRGTWQTEGRIFGMENR